MKNERLPFYLAAALALATGPALADSHESCPLTYETFEYSVPHSDMEECPDSMDTNGSFCRVAIVAEVATVFTFSEEPGYIVKSSAFEEDQFEIEFQWGGDRRR